MIVAELRASYFSKAQTIFRNPGLLIWPKPEQSTVIWMGQKCPNNHKWWNTTLICDFCIPVDFLGINDLKKIKKGRKKIWRPRPRPQWKIWFFNYFFPWLGSYGVNLMEKGTDLRLKAIKVTKRPYISQICNLPSGTPIIVIFVFQY